GNVTGQVRTALAGSATMVRKNRQLLDDALRAVGEALAVVAGETSSRSHDEATRLKAVILYHKGLAELQKARLRRRQADRHRSALSAIVAHAAESAAAQTLVADAGIAEQIDRLTQAEATARGEWVQNTEQLAALDERIADRQARLDAAQARADAARRGMDEIKTIGLDFAQPRAVELFREKLLARMEVLRQASREAHDIVHGQFPDAVIDVAGDALTGRYIDPRSGGEPTVVFGLLHDQHERAALAETIAREREALHETRSAIERLQATMEGYEQRQREAIRRLADLKDRAAGVFEAMDEAESEAFAIEERALDWLEKSARAAGQAAQYAEQGISEAGRRAGALSTEARQRSAFDARTKDRWMSGFVATQGADAKIVKAWIQYDRFAAAGRLQGLSSHLAALLDEADIDLETLAEQRVAARRAGVEEITRARKLLDKVHGKARDHWTLAAQAAGTTYLITLFGYDNYLADTIEAYRRAVAGRETKPAAATFVARLNRLESR
ncbi:MAG: hypothetical protein ACE5EX_08615, partial [Phycisphaerae bacterium]